MSRLILVSDKLPNSYKRNGNTFIKEQRVGGFNSALRYFHQHYDALWVASPKIHDSELSVNEKIEFSERLKKENYFPIFPSSGVEEKHDGFCHNTLWPLFHYFPENTEYQQQCWDNYLIYNNLFAEKLEEIIEAGDRIWIHDYHLMLLPGMLRKKFPNISIGFFLHVPFPSYEIFRLLPWRTEILEGLTGSDLIGFHTYDYERHFLSCVRRLLGYETVFNQIRMDDKVVKAENFPLGINFDKFTEASNVHATNNTQTIKLIDPDVKKQYLKSDDRKTILSIDRLDYTKGIADRLRVYEHFLRIHPEYHQKVNMMLIVIPSREEVDHYQRLKSEIDELVGRINGKYGVINWMPVWYFYRKLTFDELIDVYCDADIAMFIPIRDGMNLMSKEFVACRINNTGSVIISEMAGASKEMSEAFIVNPNNWAEIDDALVNALNLSVEEQKLRMTSIRKRLARYTEKKWGDDFLQSLEGVKDLQATNFTKRINSKILNLLKETYDEKSKRILFLDYDGTLTGFNKDPQKAEPNEELYAILKVLSDDEENDIVIISGRDKETLEKWFDEKWRITFVAEHGVWKRKIGDKWRMTEKIDKGWMETIRPLIEHYVDRTPRTFLEEKNYSLAWHYRSADPDLGTQRSWELKDELKFLVTNLNLEIMDGDKVIEIKFSGINKGRAASVCLTDKKYDFIFAIGDDWTDEYTFQVMPEEAFTVKVGTKTTSARFYLEDVKEVRELLITFASPLYTKI